MGEPTSFKVKEESQFKGGATEFTDTKLMTRLTYTLDDMSGKLKVGADGKVEFEEEDGIDYAPTTVQLPGGERVPFLFTVMSSWPRATAAPSSPATSSAAPQGAVVPDGPLPRPEGSRHDHRL